MASQQLSLPGYDEQVRHQIAAWDGFAHRIWERDHTLWVPQPRPEIADRLGWLDLPETMAGSIDDLTAFGGEMRADGVDRVVLAGMGGSSLAPEVFTSVFPTAIPLAVLDSTHPDAVAAIAAQATDRTLFIVASKSGTTIEPLSFLDFFWDRTSGDGSRFVAITDPGTPLAELARDRRFRAVFEATPDVGGRYSALTAFGLVPAAIAGVPIGDVLRSAAAVRTLAADEGPPLALGAALSVLARAGRDKVTFLCSQGLAAFPPWLEQLIAESTGKTGTGIVPIVGEAVRPPTDYGDDRLFVYYSLAGDDDAAQADAVAALEAAGLPVVRIALDEPAEIGGEMYRAEFAVAAAGAGLGIHPFDQPDVQEAKALAQQAMAGESVGEVAALAIDEASDAIAAFIDGASPPTYLALLAFLSPTPETAGALEGLRRDLARATGCATTVGYGPRYLHSTGQLHKGGPATGLFLQFVDEPSADQPVPGRDYSFGELLAAQAAGDRAALEAAGRRVVTIDLGRDPASALTAIAVSKP